jgi:hypothetical protein
MALFLWISLSSQSNNYQCDLANWVLIKLYTCKEVYAECDDSGLVRFLFHCNESRRPYDEEKLRDL